MIWGVMVLGCTVQAIAPLPEDSPPEYMSKEDREMLKLVKKITSNLSTKIQRKIQYFY